MCLSCVNIRTKKRVTDLTRSAIEQICALYYCKGHNITYDELKFVLSANRKTAQSILSPFYLRFLLSSLGVHVETT